MILNHSLNHLESFKLMVAFSSFFVIVIPRWRVIAVYCIARGVSGLHIGIPRGFFFVVEMKSITSHPIVKGGNDTDSVQNIHL